MKWRYDFCIRSVGGETVAIAVGEDAARFRGMLKLNDTALCLFQRLAHDATQEDLVAELCESFAVEREEATQAVQTFLRQLEKHGWITA